LQSMYVDAACRAVLQKQGHHAIIRASNGQNVPRVALLLYEMRALLTSSY